MRYLIILDREVLAKASDTSVERQQSTRKALGKAQNVSAESESLYLGKGFLGEKRWKGHFPLTTFLTYAIVSGYPVES